ncbi:MAG: LuxR family transcriptional regulator [bacterium]|nr:LuxR family transcriptional regulator [bacterium]
MDASDLLSRAADFIKLGNAQEAERLCWIVLNAPSPKNGSPSSPSLHQRADAYHRLALTLCDLGKYADAVLYGQHAEEAYRTVNDEGSCGGAVTVQGSAYIGLGDYAHALERFLTARTMVQRAGDRERECQVLCKIGHAHLKIGELIKARNAYVESADLARHLGNDQQLANAKGGLGLVYRHLGDPPLAIQALEESLEVDTRLGNLPERARHLGNLGNVYQELGDLHRAIQLYEDALAVCQQLGQRKCEATWLHNLGVVHQTLGDLDTALQHFEKALDIEISFDLKAEQVRSYGRIASIHSERGEYDAAISLLERVLALTQDYGIAAELPMWRSNLAHIHTLAGNLASAQMLLNDAIPQLETQGNVHQIGAAWHFQAVVLADVRSPNHDKAAAIELIERALDLFTKVKAKRNMIEAHESLSALYKAQGSWTASTHHQATALLLSSELINEEIKLYAQRTHFQRQIGDVRREQEFERIAYRTKDVELQQLIDRLVEKNNLLRQISQQVESAKQHMRPQGTEQLEQLLNHINNSLRSDATVQTIDQLLSEAYKSLVERLRLRVAAITEMEVKVAMLLFRQMTSANIAGLLFLSKRTVEAHRHNLRKKLGLHATEDIYLFLKQL